MTPSVHPRACGEHIFQYLTLVDPIGSSPRMRGTPWRRSPLTPASRFIPAHAGNTFVLSSSRMLRSVHPRACGEHTGSKCHAVNVSGSSPRMRGTQQLQQIIAFGDRFIPAHAGNTQTSVFVNTFGSVHPRACGEHCNMECIMVGSSGSSPRMRGTPGTQRPQS